MVSYLMIAACPTLRPRLVAQVHHQDPVLAPHGLLRHTRAHVPTLHRNQHYALLSSADQKRSLIDQVDARQQWAGQRPTLSQTSRHDARQGDAPM
jgi:hypothetical protein